MPLPTDAQERKNIPVYSGFIKYFPDAIVEVAKVSKRGNDQHNPGTPLHWDRSKSSDELDALARHLLDGATPGLQIDELIEQAAARTWRSLADLQKLCEQRDSADRLQPARPLLDGLSFNGLTDADLRLRHSREGTPEPRTPRKPTGNLRVPK